MANKATLNPGPEALAMRNVGRIERLKQAIAKAEANGNSERVESLQAELDRRMAEVRTLRAALDSVED